MLITFVLCLVSTVSGLWETRFVFYRGGSLSATTAAQVRRSRVDLDAYPEHFGLVDQPSVVSLPVTTNNGAGVGGDYSVGPNARPGASAGVSPFADPVPAPVQRRDAKQPQPMNQLADPNAIRPTVQIPTPNLTPAITRTSTGTANDSSRSATTGDTAPSLHQNKQPILQTRSSPIQPSPSEKLSPAPPTALPTIPSAVTGPDPDETSPLNTINRLLDRGVSTREISMVIRMLGEQNGGHEGGSPSEIGHVASPPPPAYS